MPSLRERRGDIPVLAAHFLERFRAEHHRATLAFSPESLQALTAWPWPGNVRELEHAIERAVLLSEGNLIRPGDLGLHDPTSNAALPGSDPGRSSSDLVQCLRSLFDGERPPTLREALAIPEREIIRLALELHGGNRQATAKMLDVNRSTLFNKMRRHGLMGRRGDEGQ
jgi:DNA-binding NtrC family response regulator